jgi:hypothetical protein
MFPRHADRLKVARDPFVAGEHGVMVVRCAYEIDLINVRST